MRAAKRHALAACVQMQIVARATIFVIRLGACAIESGAQLRPWTLIAEHRADQLQAVIVDWRRILDTFAHLGGRKRVKIAEILARRRHLLFSATQGELVVCVDGRVDGAVARNARDYRRRSLIAVERRL